MVLSLSNLRGFVAVVEQGSFRKAAEELGRSQPALSTQISNLEEYLGLSLLARTTRKVRLTDEGERFYHRVRRVLSELESVTAELKDEAALQRGRVIVGCVPTIASYVFPQIIKTYSEKFPGIAVRLVDEVAETIERRVLSAEVDFGIGPAPQRSNSLSFQPLVTDSFVVIFPSTSKFAGRFEVPLDEILEEATIIMRPGTNVRTIIDNCLAKQGKSINPRYEVLHHYTMGGMVEAGLGVTILPSMALSMMSNPLLKTAKIVQPEIKRTIGIIQRKGEVLSPAAEALLTIMIQKLPNSLDAQLCA